MFMDTTLFLFVLFGFLLLWNTPIAIGLGMASLIAIYLSGAPLAVFPLTMYAATAKFALLAIPFFILAGVVMEAAGVSSRLIKFADVCVGHITGGLAIVGVVTCCFFAAISGSGPATVAALGTIMIPAMVKAGYDKGFSSALMANAGAIGIIIPPSIAFVVYGVIAEVSIGKLFMAGVMPWTRSSGLRWRLSAIIFPKNVVTVEMEKKLPELRFGRHSRMQPGDLMTPVIILGGIYGGVFTPTEAAGVAAVYGLFVGFFVYKELNWEKLKKLLIDSSVGSAVVMLIVSAASLFAWLLTTEGAAQAASAAMVDFSKESMGYPA